MDMTEGRVRELENRAIESIQGEEQREKKVEKNKVIRAQKSVR